MKKFLLITMIYSVLYAECTPFEVSVYISEKDGWMFTYSTFYWGMSDGVSEIQQFNDECYQLLENNSECIMNCIMMEQDELDINLGRVGCIYYNCPDGDELIQNYEEHAQRPTHLYGELYCAENTNWDAVSNLCQSNYSTEDTNNDGLIDSFPLITIIGDNVQILTQVPNDSNEIYIDFGASCYIGEEDISQNVEVSGDIVDLRNIGIYNVVYNCADVSGNQALTKNRTIIVQADYLDENDDGFDDVSFDAGAISGDINLDGYKNVLDVVELVYQILNP